jgi:adenine phosphoribosyltransferase
MTEPELKALIRDVPDFPRPGIVFKDLTPLLADPVALPTAIDLLADQVREATGPIDLVVGAEARGFIFGPALAAALGAGFVPARRPGKLPARAESVEYELEYGVGALEVHVDAIGTDKRIVVHDDLLATGGTAAALAALAERLGAEVVAFSFLIELEFLGGRARLGGPVRSLLRYQS